LIHTRFLESELPVIDVGNARRAVIAGKPTSDANQEARRIKNLIL